MSSTLLPNVLRNGRWRRAALRIASALLGVAFAVPVGANAVESHAAGLRVGVAPAARVGSSVPAPASTKRPKPVGRTLDLSVAYGSGHFVQLLSLVADNRCINIENGSRVRGSRVIIAVCGSLPGGNTASETFTWNATTGEIKVFDGTPDVKCIAIAGGSLTSGQAIVTWDCHGGPDEKWEPGADGRSIVLRGTTFVWTCLAATRRPVRAFSRSAAAAISTRPGTHA